MDNIHNDTHVYSNSVNINNVQSYLQLNISLTSTVTLLTSSCMTAVNFYTVKVFLTYNSEFPITSQLLIKFLTFTHPIISDDSSDDVSNFFFHSSISLSAAGKFAALKAEPAFEPARHVRLT